MVKWKIAVCTIILLGIGCATPATFYNIQRSWTTAYDFDDLWTGVITLFSHNNIPIATLEKDSGIIVSDWFVLGGKDPIEIDCGSPGLAISYEKYAKMTITVRPVGSDRQITVNAQYQQRRVFDRREFYARCYSKGAFEKNIKEIIISNVSASLRNQ